MDFSGSALTHHPHAHVIVPGGGLSPDSERWIACQPGFFLPVRVLSRRGGECAAGGRCRKKYHRRQHRKSLKIIACRSNCQKFASL
jgi:hypothetical protein